MMMIVMIKDDENYENPEGFGRKEPTSCLKCRFSFTLIIIFIIISSSSSSSSLKSKYSLKVSVGGGVYITDIIIIMERYPSGGWSLLSPWSNLCQLFSSPFVLLNNPTSFQRPALFSSSFLQSYLKIFKWLLIAGSFDCWASWTTLVQWHTHEYDSIFGEQRSER